MPRPPVGDVGGAVLRPARDAGVAGGEIGLAAVTRRRRRQQVDLRADGEVVVNRHVERSAEPVEQGAQAGFEPQPVVHVHAVDAEAAQEGDEIFELPVGERHLGVMGQARHRQGESARPWLEPQEVGASAHRLQEFADVPVGASAQRMHHDQDRRLGGVPKQCRRGGEPAGLSGVGLHVPCDCGCVVRVAGGQQIPRPRSLRRVLAEAGLAGVEHERVTGQHVPPSGRRRPQAEVVLLAVAPAEGRFVERAHGVEAVAPDVHAEADGGGQVDLPTAVGSAERRIHLGGGAARWQRSSVNRWPAADRGVVGEGRDGADPRGGVGMPPEPHQPAGGHLGIAVEQNDVAVARGRHAPVDRGDEAAVRFVP